MVFGLKLASWEERHKKKLKRLKAKRQVEEEKAKMRSLQLREEKKITTARGTATSVKFSSKAKKGFSDVHKAARELGERMEARDKKTSDDPFRMDMNVFGAKPQAAKKIKKAKKRKARAKKVVYYY